jgi:hypothetical protein
VKPFARDPPQQSATLSGTKRGRAYHLLAYDQGPRKLFEPFLITMEDEAELA